MSTAAPSPFPGVGFDSQTPLHRMGDTWLWSNSISATVTPHRVEGVDRSDWIRSLAQKLAGEPDFLWGAAYLSVEFHATNIDSRGGMRAIGRNARRHLPGLYWLNFFGPTYTALMDVESARGSGIGRWEDIGDALAVECHLDPEDWEVATENKKRIMEVLGADLFFDRGDRRRPTRAPDFALPGSAQPSAKPLEAFTSHGTNAAGAARPSGSRGPVQIAIVPSAAPRVPSIPCY